MRISPLLLAGSLLFWGWQTGIFWVAMLMAVLLELAHVFKWRWDFSESDFNRVWDLCTILFVGAGLYCFISRDANNDLMEFLQSSNFTHKNKAMNEAIQTAYIFFQWMPMTFFPMALAQMFGTSDKVPVTVFSWYLRKRKRLEPGAETPSVNIMPVYFAVILASTSVANSRSEWFYLVFAILMAWALWFARPRRFPDLVWLAAILLVAKAGYWGHTHLNSLQSTIEGTVSEWVARWMRGTGSGTESRTAIGRIGRLKLSGKILYRVEPKGAAPSLLRDSSYNMYEGGLWYVAEKDFGEITSEGDATTWRLLSIKDGSDAVDIYGYFQRGRLILPLPPATTLLTNLPVAAVKSNRFGVVRAEEGPGLVKIHAVYGATQNIDSRPDPADTFVSSREQRVINQVAAKLNLDSLHSDGEKINAIRNYFLRDFTYSTYVPAAGNYTENMTQLGNFLLNTHAGHCEYFGTATTLLMRRAGIPARYANGYSLQEKEAFFNRYIVRERHAHAWCIYYDVRDKLWKDFDTTPASWEEIESKRASLFEPLSDLGSRIWFEFSKWRWLGNKGDLRQYLGWALIPLVAVLVWRLFFKKKMSRADGDKKAAALRTDWPGLDSEFYQVEKRLNELGLNRYPGESLSAWFRRLERVPNLSTAPLRTLLELHYRYRFDPRGIEMVDREKLKAGVLTWLKQSTPAI